MLSERRERLHHAAGKALESLYAGRTSEVQDRLAYHYSRAGEPATAILHLDRLAADNLERHAHEEAAAAVRQALEQAARLAPEQRAAVKLDLTIRLVDSLYFLGELAEGEQLLAELAPAVERLSDPRAEARFAFWRAHTLSHLGDPDGARAEAERALRTAPAGTTSSVAAPDTCSPARRGGAGGSPKASRTAVRRQTTSSVRTTAGGWCTASATCGHNLLYLGQVERRTPDGEPGSLARRGGRRSPPQELRRLEPRHVPRDARRRRGRGAGVRARPRAVARPRQHRLGRGHARVRALAVRPPRARPWRRSMAASKRSAEPGTAAWSAGSPAGSLRRTSSPATPRRGPSRARRLREAERVRVPWAAARALRVVGGGGRRGGPGPGPVRAPGGPSPPGV